MARLRGNRLGARRGHRARVAEFRALRGAARAGSRAVEAATARAPRVAAAQRAFPARQPAAVQSQVLSGVATPLRRVREAPGSAAGGNRSACGGGLSPLQRERAPVTLQLAGGLVLALGSALPLHWGYFLQDGSRASLPPLALPPP